MEFRELGTDAEIQSAFPLMAQLRDRVRAETFLAEIRYLDCRATARGFYDRLGFQFLTSIPCWIDAAGLSRIPEAGGEETS